MATRKQIKARLNLFGIGIGIPARAYAIGIEQDPHYLELSRARMTTTSAELDAEELESF